MLVVHYRQGGRNQALITYPDTFGLLDDIIFRHRPLKRRIALHNITVEGQLRTAGLKCILTKRLKGLMSSFRRTESNVN